jgi:hypothetical protein
MRKKTKQLIKMKKLKNKLTKKIELRKKIQINRLKISLSKYILKSFLGFKKERLKARVYFFMLRIIFHPVYIFLCQE